MDASREYLVWLANAEFGGGSFNGPSLIETLESLSVDDARSTATYEGYSAWGAALHVLYYKHLVAKQICAEVPPYLHEEKDWPALPEAATQDSYAAVINELRAVHELTTRSFASATTDALAEPMPGWNVPLWKAYAWLVSHDTNHNTQIRNMGLPLLRGAQPG
jgi:uncharacterized damage-inducible protein DinB